MAANVVTETRLVRLGGNTPGMMKLYGTVANTDQTTIYLKPGNHDTNVTGSAGLRKIYSCSLRNLSAEKAPIATIAYDATQDGDMVTITCASGDDYAFVLEGEDNGA